MTPGRMFPRFSDIFGDRGIGQSEADQWTKFLLGNVPETAYLPPVKKEKPSIVVITDEFPTNIMRIWEKRFSP